MYDYGRSNRRVSNYHPRSQQVYTELSDEPNYQHQISPKITYDVNERLASLQKQQNYRRMLDEQVNGRYRVQTRAASHSYGKPHRTDEDDREAPLTAYTDTVPFSPYSRDSVDFRFKRQLELNR